MKKVLIEGRPAHSYELFVEDTPVKGDRTLRIFGYDAFAFLNKSFQINQRAVISIDEGGGAVSFVLLVGTNNNGYVRRERQSGQFEVGRIFHIASPVYYVKKPFREGRNLIGIESDKNRQSVMFFPEAAERANVDIDNFMYPNMREVYGRSIGVAGFDMFFETTGITLMNDNITNQKIRVSNYSGQQNPYYVVGGEYEIL